MQIEGASWLPVINAVESLVAWQAMNKDWLIKFNQLLAEAKWQDEIDRINAEKANAARKQRR